MRFFHAALGVTLFLSLLSHPAHGGPAPFAARAAGGKAGESAATDAPRPLPRPPSDDRRPLELVGGGRLLASPCSLGGGASACAAEGPAFGVALVALHRYSPYFAFGLEGFAFRSGAERADAESHALELSAVSRVYLFESGTVDPYLELLLGYGSERSEGGAESRTRVTNVRGPSARIGGGLDVTLWDALRTGLSLAYREDLFGPDVRCARGRCAKTAWVLARGHFVLGFGVSVSLGEPL